MYLVVEPGRVRTAVSGKTFIYLFSSFIKWFTYIYVFSFYSSVFALTSFAFSCFRLRDSIEQIIMILGADVLYV